MHPYLVPLGIRLARSQHVRKAFLSCNFCLLVLLLVTSVVRADDAALAPWRGLLGYLNPRTWPFIPVPEVGTDPNGGTTVGILPVFLFVDEHQQVNRIVNGDLTYSEWEFDATYKGAGRIKQTQVSARRWKNGKVVHERFYYNKG